MFKKSGKIAASKPVTSKKKYLPSFEKSLRYLAFDNSAQASIILTTSTGKIELANAAACKLLGYSHKQILSVNRDAIFDSKEDSFKKMLKQRTAEGKSIAFVTAVKKNGKHFSCQVTSAVFLDEASVEKSITTITDLSQQIKRQKNIDHEKEQIVAYDIMHAKSEQKDIDSIKEKIVADNIVLAKSEQNDIDTIKEKIVADNIEIAILKQTDIDTRKDKIVADNIEIAISKQRKIDSRNVKVVAHNIAVTKSKQKKLDIKNEKIVAGNIVRAQAKSDARHEESNQWIKSIARASYDVMWDWDISTGEIYVGESIKEIFGYKILDNTLKFSDFTTCLLPDEKKELIKELWITLSSDDKKWEASYKIKRKDDSIASTISRASIVRNNEGKAIRLIGATQDISLQKDLEDKLELEIKLKEKKIEEATHEARETERSDIGKELHDNVNQLLSASKLYLDMAKKGGGESEMFIIRSTEYTLSAIEAIRRLTKGLTSDAIKDLGLCIAIESVAKDMMQVNNLQITCNLDTKIEDKINDKFKLNIFRITQEQISNILKHAEATKVTIQLSQNKQFILLNITDNGVGFDTTKKRKGIGLDNIKSRAEAFNGKADFVSGTGKGCVLKISFPLADVQVSKVH